MKNEVIVELTRNDFYNKVWTTPMTEIAKEFGLHAYNITFFCDKYHIPKPPNGYWKQKEFGKQLPPQPSLPPIENSELQTVHIPKILRPDEELPPEFLSHYEFEYDPANRIVVPNTLRSPHPLIAKTKQIFSDKNTLHEASYHQDGGYLNLSVSQKMLNRALRIMDTFLKAIEQRKYSVDVVKEDWSWFTQITILNEKFKIHLREKYKQVKREPCKKKNKWSISEPKVDYVYTGEFELRLLPYDIILWKDGKDRIEDNLNFILAELVHRAGVNHVSRLKHQQAEKERREKERIELERRWKEEEIQQQENERKRKEQERVDTLFKEANLYDSCQKIRAYILAVHNTAVEKNGQIQEGSPMAAWIEWASQIAEHNDPVKRRINEINP